MSTFKTDYYWSDTFKKLTKKELDDYNKEIDKYGVTAGENYPVSSKDLEQHKLDVLNGKKLKFVGL